jgi:hypothetical protein
VDCSSGKVDEYRAETSMGLTECAGPTSILILIPILPAVLFSAPSVLPTSCSTHYA